MATSTIAFIPLRQCQWTTAEGNRENNTIVPKYESEIEPQQNHVNILLVTSQVSNIRRTLVGN